MTEVKSIEVLGSNISYLESGSGNPILLLHSMPVSNYIWRDIMPVLSRLGRCIAPDMIGFGESDKPEIDYTIEEHLGYLEGLIDSLNLKNITIVVHGWGSILGLSYAMKHQDNIRGIVAYEAYLKSDQIQDGASLPMSELISDYRRGRDEYFHNSASLTAMLESKLLEQFSSDSMEKYLAPFEDPMSQRALQKHMDGLCDLEQHNEQSALTKIIEDYSQMLTSTDVPFLLLYGFPGMVMTIDCLNWARDHIANVEVVELGESFHFAQEVQPGVFAESVSVWIQGLETS